MILAIKSFWRQKRNLNVRWFIIVIIASANWHFLLGTSALEKLGLRDWIPCVGWMKHGEAAGTGGNESMKGVGIVWVGTGMFTHPILDTWITTPKPIAKSQATGQQLSTGEPRIWLNLQTLDSARTQIKWSDYARTEQVCFFGAWLSSALHGLKVADGHAQE